MSNQQTATRDSAEMRRIGRKWELFVSGADVDLSDVPPVIREAWIRSKNAGVDPALSHAPWRKIPDDPEILRKEIDWLPCAENVTELLLDLFTEPHQLVFLVDHRGRLISIGGGRKAMAKAEQIGAIPGGEWAESQVGCNVIGTTLYTGRPLQVCWQENYIVKLQDWTSQAAPIRDPLGGSLLGAVGVGGHEEISHPRAFELFTRSAEMIEERLRERETRNRLAILERFSELAGRYPGSGLLALDRRGRILTVNPPAEKVLSLPAEDLLGRDAQEVAGLQEHLSGSDRTATIFPLSPPLPSSGGTANGSVILLPEASPHGSRQRRREQPWPATYTFADLVGRDPVFLDGVNRAQRAAARSLPVLLCGESGTGKELLAQSIHNASACGGGPFVPLDCASASEELIGMELFGYEQGSFTGALRTGKVGRLQLADRGTLFLDDVDNLPQKMQSALLRVLETSQVVPIGGRKPVQVDVRFIAASNSNLDEAVRERRFRLDLYHRLKVLTITLPPLRERLGDVRVLAEHVLTRHAPRLRLAEDALDRLRGYAWPGNVRELRNVLLEAMDAASGDSITAADLPEAIRGAGGTRGPSSRRRLLDSTEAELIRATIEQTENARQAASRLGVHLATLYRRMQKYGIKPRSGH